MKGQTEEAGETLEYDHMISLLPKLSGQLTKEFLLEFEQKPFQKSRSGRRI